MGRAMGALRARGAAALRARVLPRGLGLLGLGLCLAALGGCQWLGALPWWDDKRPWFANHTAEMLEIESTHADGHRLKILLYPGTRVPLGAAANEIREIAVRRRREPEVRVPQSQIRACLQLPPGACLGWQVSAAGLEPLARARDGS